VHIVVCGRVQGVSFRAYAQSVARALELQGYVRNLPNGDVEIVAEGEGDKLDRLIEWARKGPPMAHVEDVRVEFSNQTGVFRDFTIEF